jgi:hypothetical protein
LRRRFERNPEATSNLLRSWERLFAVPGGPSGIDDLEGPGRSVHLFAALGVLEGRRTIATTSSNARESTMRPIEATKMAIPMRLPNDTSVAPPSVDTSQMSRPKNQLQWPGPLPPSL